MDAAAVGIDCYEYVTDHFNDDPDPVEAAKVDGMLAKGQHRKGIVEVVAVQRCGADWADGRWHWTHRTGSR